MLKLQRHVRTITTKSNKSDSSGAQSIIYGSSSDPEEQKALKAFTKQINQPLSPRTKVLHAGMFPTLSSRKSASSRMMMQEEDVGFTLQDID